MNKRRLTIISTALVALLLTGCEGYATYTPSALDLTRIANEWPDDDPNKPTVQAIAIQRYATAMAAESVAQQAELTRQAAQAEADRQKAILTAEAGATADALNIRATTDALNVQATRQTMDTEATRTAEARIAAEMATRQAIQATATQQARNIQVTADARNATATSQAQAVQATREAERATARAVAAQATATVQAHEDNATATVISATTQAVTLQAERERWLHPFRIIGVILLVLAGALAVSWLGWRFAQVMEDRARVIRRRPDEGEPIIVWRERWGLPLRAFSPIVDATPGQERAPQLAPVEVQEATTMRQQTSNALQARQVGEVARARSKFPTLTRRRRRSPSSPVFPRPPRLRTPTTGLVNVVAVDDLVEAAEQGVLAPNLAAAIEGQWTEVKEEV